MRMYKCTKCGYLYNPKSGDYTQGIAPNTSFEDLPENWVCPRCNAPKSAFEPVD